MPGTHLLPANLLKLFAPRPPLPYSRPVDRDIDRVTKKAVGGVAHILAQLKEANTEALIAAGSGEAPEEGEEPTFSHAEETKRQIKREARKARKHEEFKLAKDTCSSCFPFILVTTNPPTDKPADDPQAIGDPYKTLFISRLVPIFYFRTSSH